MTWHETIAYIRTKPDFQDLVRLAYFDADLKKNVEAFGHSEEFVATLQWIQQLAPNAKTLVDIGAGNGIAALNFALQGYQVTAVEPDGSNSVGAGAIDWLKNAYQLNNLSIVQSIAETLALQDNSVDIVYIRQAMHHADNLNVFIANCARILKKGGLLMTVRDHVVYNKKDKAWFLEAHPLQKFYGGENAYHPDEYHHAMQLAGLEIVHELKYYDSVINYFPGSVHEITHHQENVRQHLKSMFQKKWVFFQNYPFCFHCTNLKIEGIMYWMNRKFRVECTVIYA